MKCKTDSVIIASVIIVAIIAIVIIDLVIIAIEIVTIVTIAGGVTGSRRAPGAPDRRYWSYYYGWPRDRWYD